jgi:hypothetical protein
VGEKMKKLISIVLLMAGLNQVQAGTSQGVSQSYCEGRAHKISFNISLNELAESLNVDGTELFTKLANDAVLAKLSSADIEDVLNAKEYVNLGLNAYPIFQIKSGCISEEGKGFKNNIRIDLVLSGYLKEKELIQTLGPKAVQSVHSDLSFGEITESSTANTIVFKSSLIEVKFDLSEVSALDFQNRGLKAAGVKKIVTFIGVNKGEDIVIVSK